MPELLLLEGDDLPGLMARVRDELGPRATIVRAERVRSGGVAGFFAREHFELTVEVPDQPRSRPVARAVDPFDALLDAADRAEARAGSPVAWPSAAAGSAARAGSGASASPFASPSSPDESDESDEPPVSTAGPRFAAVLERARALAAEPGASSGARSAGAVPDPPAEAVAAVASRPATVPVASPSAAVRVPSSGAVALPAVPVGGAPAPATWRQAALALLAAGVPGELIDHARSVSDVLGAISEPPRPPRRPGQVLALVGEPDAAADVAALLRHQWRLPEQAVLTAGEGGLTSSAGVVRWRIRSGEAEHPWLLVVGTPDDRQGRHLATGLVAAAQPDQVWAVLDARTKPEFAARWLEQVGAARHVDALAVEGLLEAADPGTVLGLGVPVAWADGVPASRVLWAAVLGQGLDESLARPR